MQQVKPSNKTLSMFIVPEDYKNMFFLRRFNLNSSIESNIASHLRRTKSYASNEASMLDALNYEIVGTVKMTTKLGGKAFKHDRKPIKSLDELTPERLLHIRRKRVVAIH